MERRRNGLSGPERAPNRRQSLSAAQHRSFLTPNSRLKKFKLIRDRNLRKMEQNLNVVFEDGQEGLLNGRNANARHEETSATKTNENKQHKAPENGISNEVDSEDIPPENNIEVHTIPENGLENEADQDEQPNGRTSSEPEDVTEAPVNNENQDFDQTVVDIIVEDVSDLPDDDSDSIEIIELDDQVNVIEPQESAESDVQEVEEAPIIPQSSFDCRNRNFEVSSRRPLRPSLKRKMDQEESDTKRKKTGTLASSITSSPLFSFWSPGPTSRRSTSTPFSSTFRDASMVVNLDDETINERLSDDLDQSSISRPSSWRCNVM